MIKLRPKQEEVLSYQSGTLGISAVPGSGKTFTLSLLATRLLVDGMLEDDQEILIVTLINSAVDNFRQRIGGFMRDMNLLPNIGYRVRTLHGLAHDIIRERSSLVGLDDSFQIVDEQEAFRIRRRALEAWLKANPGAIIDDLMPSETLEDEGRANWVRDKPWPQMAQEVSGNMIARAKDLRLTPADLSDRLEEIGLPLPLLELSVEVYRKYEQALRYRGAVDFQDLVRLAIKALEEDQQFCERLRDRWPYILEDEAQDSSQLQEDILRQIVGDYGNWVRVGDPNQAIYETFTTASPEHLLTFLQEAESRRELPNSGRSTQSIITLANHLIQWSRSDHPIAELRSALSKPLILPAPEGDPQPNPPDSETQIEFVDQAFQDDEEIEWICDHIASWLPQNNQRTVAVLVPTNALGAKIEQALSARQLTSIELLRTSGETRRTTGALTYFLAVLAEPRGAKELSAAYKVFRRSDREDATLVERTARGTKLLKKLQKPESFLSPAPGYDWKEEISLDEGDSLLTQEMDAFRTQLQRWQDAANLPIDQLVLTIAQDFFQEPAELALANKLASMLRLASESNPEWRLAEFREELVRIAKNERSFLGFTDEDTGFDPDAQRGKVVIATYHKAKGLEWDRVYLTGANNFHFPSALPEDPYFSDRTFIRDRLDLTAEAQAQLEALLDNDPYNWYEEGLASERNRTRVAAESLRAFYVGITRARRELFVTYNTGPKKNNVAAVPFTVLKTFQDGGSSDPSS